MPWTFANGIEMTWPAAFDRKTYAKADKGGQIEDVLASLDALRSGFNKLTPPGTPIARPPLIVKWEDDSKKFIAGPLKQLIGSLQIVAKRAENMEKAGSVKVKGKDVKLTTESKAALKTIRTECTAHAASIAPNVVGPQLTALRGRLEAKATKEVLDRLRPTVEGFKKNAAKGHPGVAKAHQLVRAWPADPAAQAETRMAVGRELANDSRDMTQNLANLGKALQAGVDPATIGLRPVDVQTLPKVNAALVKYGNSSDGVSAFVDGLTKDQMTRLVALVDSQAQLYDQISARLV